MLQTASKRHVTHLLETFQGVKLEGFVSFPAKRSIKLTLYLLVVYSCQKAVNWVPHVLLSSVYKTEECVWSTEDKRWFYTTLGSTLWTLSKTGEVTD